MGKGIANFRIFRWMTRRSWSIKGKKYRGDTLERSHCTNYPDPVSRAIGMVDRTMTKMALHGAAHFLQKSYEFVNSFRANSASVYRDVAQSFSDLSRERLVARVLLSWSKITPVYMQPCSLAKIQFP